MHEPFQLRGQRVLVTGGAGFLGRHLCARLTELGAEVHASSRRERDNNQAVRNWWRVSNADDLDRLVHELRPEVIYHLAGQVSAAPGIELIETTFKSLLESTVRLLTVATELHCRRVILIGSLTEPKANAASPAPSSPYAAAKWASSVYASMFHRLYGTPVVTVRPFMAYGPGQHPAKIIPYVIESLIAGRAPQLASGRWAADWVYVSDVIEGLIQAATVADIEGEDFDLATGTLTATADVIAHLAELLEGHELIRFGALADRPNEHVRAANVERTQARLGWSFNTSLPDGLRQTVHWHQQQHQRLCVET